MQITKRPTKDGNDSLDDDNDDDMEDSNTTVQPFALSDPDALWKCEERDAARLRNNNCERDGVEYGFYDFWEKEMEVMDDGDLEMYFPDPAMELATTWSCTSAGAHTDNCDECSVCDGDVDDSDWEEWEGVCGDEHGVDTGDWMGVVCQPGMLPLDPTRYDNTNLKLSRWAGRRPGTFAGDGGCEYPMMWFRGDGIPKGFWMTWYGCQTPETRAQAQARLLGQPRPACDIRTPDADAGTELWVLCMGSAPDNRETKSTLQSLFHSPIMDRKLLNEVIAYICPNRVGLTKAVASNRNQVTKDAAHHGLLWTHADSAFGTAPDVWAM